MNIFYLDNNPEFAAHYHNNKHCSKMILETAQMLSTNVRLLRGTPEKVYITPERQRIVNILPEDDVIDLNGQRYLPKENRYVYLEAHKNHPCIIWARESYENFNWLCQLGEQLYIEKFERTNVGHASDVITNICASYMRKEDFPSITFTKPALAMPEQYQTSDPVESYRNYYMGDKRHLADWSPVKQPYWWK